MLEAVLRLELADSYADSTPKLARNVRLAPASCDPQVLEGSAKLPLLVDIPNLASTDGPLY